LHTILYLILVLFDQGKYSLGVPIVPQSYTKLVLKNGEVSTEEFYVEGNQHVMIKITVNVRKYFKCSNFARITSE
jgi:hypothetical protein